VLFGVPQQGHKATESNLFRCDLRTNGCEQMAVLAVAQMAVLAVFRQDFYGRCNV